MQGNGRNRARASSSAGRSGSTEAEPLGCRNEFRRSRALRKLLCGLLDTARLTAIACLHERDELPLVW